MTGTIARAQNGDPEAFESLVRAHEGLVHRLAWRMCYRADLAQDITQEVFFQVWRRLPQLRQPEAFPSWLYKVTYSVGVRLLSREPPEGACVQVDIPAHSPGPEEELLSKEAVGLIRDELARMHPRYRVALGLYLEGLSYEEIGRIMAVPPRTVETRLRRARKNLHHRLSGEQGGED